MYKERVYPNYLSGTGYMMSLDVAEKLFNTALMTPIFHLEDVYVTGKILLILLFYILQNKHP